MTRRDIGSRGSAVPGRLGDLAAAGILGVVAWATLFAHLGASTINTDPQDESVHAGVTVEMARTGSFEPTYHGHRYYGKPPLKMFLSARLVRVLGPSPWVLRLPDATFALATGLLLWGVLRRETGDAIAATVAPIVLWSSPHFVLLHGAREAVQDAPITFFVTLAVLTFWKAADGSSLWLLGAAVAMSGGVLVKSAVGFLPIGIGVAVLVLERRWRKLASPWLLVAVAVPVIVFFSWMGWGDLASHQGEVRYNIGKRFFAWPKHNHPWWSYLEWLWGGLSLWLVPAVAGALGAAWAIVRGPGRLGRLDARALLWVLGILVPFSLSASKLPWYSYPMYPAAALLVASVMAPARVWREPGFTAGKRLSAGIVLALALIQVDRIHDETRRVRTSIPVRLFRAIPHGAGEALYVVGIPLGDMCPDEEIHLADEGYEIRMGSDRDDVLRAARQGGGPLVLLPEEDLMAFAEAAGPLMSRARVARYAGACEPGPEGGPGKRRQLRRALVAFDRHGLSHDFAPFVAVQLRDGFYAAEPHPEEGQMQWLTREGVIRVGPSGVVRLGFRVQPFHRPRTIELRHGDVLLLRERVEGWMDLSSPPFLTGAAGTELSFSADSCDVVRDVLPEVNDRRCLSVALASVTLHGVPGESIGAP